MEEIIKTDKSDSHKEFEQLLSKDLNSRKFKEGEISTGIISKIGKKFVFVDLGLKSEGAIPIDEFKLTKEIDKIKIGSKIDVLLEKIENRSGDVVIAGDVTATSGQIAGWTISGNDLTATNMALRAGDAIELGSATTLTNGDGVFIGNNGTARFGDPDGNELKYDGTNVFVGMMVLNISRLMEQVCCSKIVETPRLRYEVELLHWVVHMELLLMWWYWMEVVFLFSVMILILVFF